MKLDPYLSLCKTKLFQMDQKSHCHAEIEMRKHRQNPTSYRYKKGLVEEYSFHLEIKDINLQVDFIN